MTAIIERPELWEVSVNDVILMGYTKDTLLDARMGDYSIGHLVRLGDNKLTLRMKRMDIRTEIGPVMLTGHFGVKGAAKGLPWPNNRRELDWATIRRPAIRNTPGKCAMARLTMWRIPVMITLYSWGVGPVLWLRYG